MGAILNNPIAWAHFKVRGGWKNHLFGTAAYAVIISAVITVTSRLSPSGSVLPGWATALLGLQLGVLLLYGCAVIGNSIRRDISGGMLESHRLMPISSGAAVLGYVTGPSFQAAGLAIVNFFIGTVITFISGLAMEKWFLANAIIAQFVLFLWVCVAFSSFVAKNAFVAIFGLMMATLLSQGNLLALLPGLTVLSTPLIGNTIFGTFFTGRAFTNGYLYSFVAQLVIGVIFYRGAMRRYRRDDMPALGVLLGMILLAAWVGTSAIGIIQWEAFRPVITRGNLENAGAPMIASLLTSMLLGLVPVAAAARSTADWRRTVAHTGRAPAARPLPPPLTALLAAGIILPLALATTPGNTIDPTTAQMLLPPIAVVLLAFFLSVSYLLRIFYRVGGRGALLVTVWIVVWWVLPLGIEAIQQSMHRIDDPRAGISLCSPLGELIDLWSERPTGSIFGLAFQCLMSLAPAVAFYATEPRRRGSARAPALEPGN